MRIIEKEMLDAIRSRKNWKKSNTEVRICDNTISVFLYSNLIAYKQDDKPWCYCSCGWHTVTTRSRLKALGCNCVIRKGYIINLETGKII